MLLHQKLDFFFSPECILRQNHKYKVGHELKEVDRQCSPAEHYRELLLIFPVTATFFLAPFRHTPRVWWLHHETTSSTSTNFEAGNSFLVPLFLEAEVPRSVLSRDG